MGKKELKGRAIWQDYSGANGGIAEQQFFDVMSSALRDTNLVVRKKPREFRNVYSSVPLPDELLKKIYNPNEVWVHGFVPDFAIDNPDSKKTLYVEVKRQDGWVEGKERKAGRGNVHERACKLFTPGLLATLRSHGHLGPDVLPFWLVLQGDIARDPKRARELHHWFTGYHDHLFLWGSTTPPLELVEHFNRRLRKLLD